jgi:hypothetical protein
MVTRVQTHSIHHRSAAAKQTEGEVISRESVVASFDESEMERAFDAPA